MSMTVTPIRLRGFSPIALLFVWYENFVMKLYIVIKYHQTYNAACIKSKTGQQSIHIFTTNPNISKMNHDIKIPSVDQ